MKIQEVVIISSMIIDKTATRIHQRFSPGDEYVWGRNVIKKKPV